ncbi:MAG: hypothetical protein ACE37N_16615 [Pseudohongiellaceae bacterium]
MQKYDDPDEAFRAAEQTIDAAERDDAVNLNLSPSLKSLTRIADSFHAPL